MEKLILKTDFIDHTDMQQYAVGSDVSHVSEEVKKFLVDNSHVEKVKAKAEKKANDE